MAPHSSTLAWGSPWREKPGRLQSMGSRRVGHNWATSLSLFTFLHWRRKWQPTPVFLPGESQGRGSLVGCRLCGRTESDTTEATQQQQQQHSNYKWSITFKNCESLYWTPVIYIILYINYTLIKKIKCKKSLQPPLCVGNRTQELEGSQM